MAGFLPPKQTGGGAGFLPPKPPSNDYWGKGLVDFAGETVKNAGNILNPMALADQAIKAGQGTIKAVGEGAAQAGAGASQFAGGMYKAGESLLQGKGNEQAAQDINQGFTKFIGGGLGVGFAPVSGAVSALPPISQKTVETTMNWPNEAIGNVTKYGFSVFKPGVSPDYVEKNVVAPLQQAANIGMLLAAPNVGKIAGEGAKIAENRIIKPLSKKVQPVIASVDAKIKPLIEPLQEAKTNLVSKVQEKGRGVAEGMINSLIKVDPAKGAEHFYKLSKGETLGKYLMDRKILGNVPEVLSGLADRFTKSKATYAKAISKIDGTYQFPVVKDILGDMQARFQKTADRINLPKVNSLLNKFEKTGLTMAENLELKRLYEQKVKTGYLKDNVSEMVDRATNLDNQLREDFNSTAKQGGFKNIEDLSRETQLARAAMDSIESKDIRRKVNNQFSLTDNLLLVGGSVNPSSLAILGIKKLASLPSVQASIIKALVGDKQAMKKIPNVPTRIINIANAAKRQAMFQDWLDTSGLRKVINKQTPKLLEAPKAIQLDQPNINTLMEARGIQLRNKTGVFEKSEPKSAEGKQS